MPSRKSYIANRQSGVALIVTLILLAVTLVMAVAFLAVSRRERASVSTETDNTTAQLAADAALSQAEAQLVAGFLSATNPYVSGLVVSTNYINGYGFVPNNPNPTNVNYDGYYNGPGPLAAADLEQNIANLLYLPRAPVYATNLVFQTNELQFYLDLNRNGRFDTNGIVTNVDNSTPPIGLGSVSLQVGDPEWIGVLEHPDEPHGPNNHFIARYCFIAVPADSLDLNRIHNQALDVDSSAGNTFVNPNSATKDAYSRDQGVGTWEINLAAFLADLNTNRWDPVLGNFFGLPVEPYNYPEPGVINASGFGNSVAFDDARALVAWRYANYYSSLPTANNLFGVGNASAFVQNGIDEYSLAQQSTFDTNYVGYGNVTWPWLGAPNTNNFFSSPSEFFDPVRSSVEFTNNLISAGMYRSTYDRYTFYRMLGQLGTDTLPESGKINVNYSNAVVNYNASGLPVSIAVVPNAATNLVSWRPLDFFTAAADKLLHAYSAEWYQTGPSNYFQTYYGLTSTYNNTTGSGLTNYPAVGITNQVPSFGITNIPVYVNGQFVYSSAVNRLLQLAANIYDAQTNMMLAVVGYSNYPSVFIPIFWTTNETIPNIGIRTDTYIAGYQYVQEPLITGGPNYFTAPVEINTLPLGLNVTNVWGVPWIIGAKKGLPNFNAFEMANRFFIERELQFNRNTTASSGSTFPYGRTYTTNQMYIMGVSNYLGVEDWNSYASNYNNKVQIQIQNYLSVSMTMTNNGTGVVPPPFTGYPEPTLMQGIIPSMASWSGYLGEPTGDPSFVLPLMTNSLWLTNSEFYLGPGSSSFGGFSFTAPCFVPTYLDPSNYLDAGTGTGPMPQFNLLITNRLQAYILDTDTRSHPGSYILDYVQLGGMNANLNINNAIADADNTGLWSTNFYNGGGNTPFGVNEQYLVSTGNKTPPPTVDNDGGGWTGTAGNGYASTSGQEAFFAAFFSANNLAYDSSDGGGIFVSNYETTIQAPYTPSRVIVQNFVYEANDPLVHYLVSDLNDYADDTNGSHQLDNPPLKYLTGLSDRYMPWGQNTMSGTYSYNGLAPNPDANKFNLSYKDPLVWSSDNWDFPSYKYPTVGWLGRVHRGSPWQTVYLKSTNIISWVPNNGNGIATWGLWTGDNNPYDAINSAPAQDRLLFDLFTAAPSDDAMRGQVNVNVDAYNPNNSTNLFDPLAGLASWSALLGGAIAFSNDVSDSTRPFSLGVSFYQNPEPTSFGNEIGPGYTNVPIQPYGITNSPMWQIVNGINLTRALFTNIDGLHGNFEHAGDILSVPQLAEQSPYLHVQNNGSVDANQVEHGISDEMYEWLPQQVMSLVTVSGTPQSPPRYVIYCYGQTLKPAPNGIVGSGNFFGLCTNYQVTAESASRAIIRVVNTPTPNNPGITPNIVVEQYNPLPPD